MANMMYEGIEKKRASGAHVHEVKVKYPAELTEYTTMAWLLTGVKLRVPPEQKWAVWSALREGAQVIELLNSMTGHSLLVLLQASEQADPQWENSIKNAINEGKTAWSFDHIGVLQ